MAVRVRIEVRCRDSNVSVVTVALVNSGYEVEEPEVLLPRRLAEYLGLSLRPPRARTEIYETPFRVYHLIFLPKAVDVHPVDASRTVEGVNVAVAEWEREVLISDKLADTEFSLPIITSTQSLNLADIMNGASTPLASS